MFPNEKQDFTIEKGEKFALLTINRAFVDIKENIEIEKDFWILRKSPIYIVDHWKDWLGTLRINEIENADLVIISKSKSLKPEMLDEQNKELWEKVSIYYQLMTLIGIVNNDVGNIVSGVLVKEFPEIREHGTPITYFRSDEYKHFTQKDFQKISDISNNKWKWLSINTQAWHTTR